MPRKCLSFIGSLTLVLVVGCPAVPAPGTEDVDDGTGMMTPAEPGEFRLDVLAYGRGHVLLDPGGGTYEEGTLVTLLAIGDGDSFTLWGRDVSGSDLITRIVVDEDKLVVALFEGRAPPSRLFEDPVIEAADGQFLGVINDHEHDAASIANPLGDHGNDASETCIWNPVSEYGSDFGEISAYSQDASEPPIVVEDGAFFAFLTTNPDLSPRLDPDDVARDVGRDEKSGDWPHRGRRRW